MTTLLGYFHARSGETLALIRSLVERESNSRDEESLVALAQFVAAELARLGIPVELLAEPGYGAHLRARFNQASDPHAPPLLLLGHLDTVWPSGTLARRPFHLSEQGAAHGPGIFDMKAGVALAIEALRALQTHRLEMRRPLTLLLTCDEEIGSRTSRPLVEAEAQGAAAALVLEPPIPGGIVKTARKGVGQFTVRAIGRAAHAGLDPRQGINAIVELAHQTLRLSSLNDFARGTTVSVGVVTGGTATNVVPAEALARVDVRYWEADEGARIERQIRGLEPELPGAQLEISGGLNRPPMPRSAGTAALFEQARALASELGFTLSEGSVGGGSDGNFTAALGLPTLDGLGVDGAGAHAEHEHILIGDIPRRAALLARLLQTV